MSNHFCPKVLNHDIKSRGSGLTVTTTFVQDCSIYGFLFFISLVRSFYYRIFETNYFEAFYFFQLHHSKNPSTVRQHIFSNKLFNLNTVISFFVTYIVTLKLNLTLTLTLTLFPPVTLKNFFNKWRKRLNGKLKNCNMQTSRSTQAQEV